MTIKIKDADGVARELAANGDGSAGNPFQPVHLAPVADGDDVCLGSIADASVAAGATGTISAKMRRLSADLGTVLTFVDGLEGLLAGGLPAALTANGGLKVGSVEPLPVGTNNIGDVDVLTLPAGTVAGSASLPVGTNNIGSTKDNGPHWTSSFGVGSAAVSSADMTIAAALTDAPTAGQKLVITDFIISSDTDMRFDFQVETSGVVVLSVFLAAKVPVQITPRSRIKLAIADKKLFGKASVAGNVRATILYFSEA